MTTNMLNRRDLLGTSAKGLAAFAALAGIASFGSPRAEAANASTCIANHQQLAQKLKGLLQDHTASHAERSQALKTCRCVHCDVAIGPML